MSRRTICAVTAILLALTALAVPAGQDFSGANQSDDPCYKIKEMKRMIRASADYRRAVGDRDPAYLQCYPMNIRVEWELNDTENKNIGTDTAHIALEEEYPAYLKLHYGWFDGLQKKQLRSYEILGPEPCLPPCPGRAKAKLAFLDATVTCCMDYPYCRTKKAFTLLDSCFQVIPAAANRQYAWLRFQYESAGVRQGEIRSSRLAGTADFCGLKKNCGRFWDPFEYQLEIDGSGIDNPIGRQLCSQGLPSPEEIMQGLKNGELTKVYNFSSRHADGIPGSSIFVLEGKATVTFAFAPIEEERWKITVEAWQMDDTAPPILYKDKDGNPQKLPISMEIWHYVTGEFVIRKTKPAWTYKSGDITKYTNTPGIRFNGSDLYKCDVFPCSGERYTGSLGGEVTGQSVKLTWPPAGELAKVCVLCKPLKSFLGKTPYREEFFHDELFPTLNQLVLPLKNGYKKEVKTDPTFRYKLTLTKVK